MEKSNIQPLNIAVRVYPAPKETKPKRKRAPKPWLCPDAMFVFDCETRTDATQKLMFGSYRFVRAGRCLEEGLFYGDDLPEKDLDILRQYAANNTADTVSEGVKQLKLISRREFVEKLYRAVYKGRALLVGFNLPFDLARVACGFTNARGRFAGGFALELWSYIDSAGHEQHNPHRPRVGIKHIDSKRALKGFTGSHNPDKADLIPEDSSSGEPQTGYKFRGHFLDLRTLAFALTDRGYSLEAACEAFGVEHGKQRAACHGVVTPEYIDYNRRDVLATYELAVKLLEEYAKHPITLQATKAYSPASIGKAYLRAMGITPILERQPDFPREYLGFAETAFFGGRTSAHIRKIAVPVVYTDFLSMYPTVNSLMDLWRFVIARRIKIVKRCQREIEDFLKQLSVGDLFKPATWKELTAFVRIVPEGDVLPVRARYSAETNDWQVGVNHLYADTTQPGKGALWFSLPDVVASVLLTGRVPKIVDAFRIESCGTLKNLKPIKLRGAIDIDPRRQDFFRIVIEERKRLASRPDISDAEKQQLDKALKVLANATSYGIYAEMNRQESEKRVNVTCHGIDEDPFQCDVAHPDVPGEYCFPPLASLITGAARLMLALLEKCVTDLGGTYAMEDTDSMAIVATEHGGPVPCAGDIQNPNSGCTIINALSWAQVKEISDKFAALNPYDRAAIPGSILKIENDNFDPKTGKQRQLHCFAISAKRYVLFLFDNDSRSVLLQKKINNKDNRWSEHGLGHLLNPIDRESEDRDWTRHVWLNILHRALKLPTEKLEFEDLPAVGRVTVGSPHVMRPLSKLNERKKYADRIKPFNFLLTCHVKQFGHPTDANAERFHLIAPYVDPKEWLRIKWVDQYSENLYRISTAGQHGTRYAARVKTYGEVLEEYEFHPESKCADATGKVCGKQTSGLLWRRHIQAELLTYIGKESNKLEDVQSALIHSAQDVYTTYHDPRRDEWQTKILPALKKAPLSVFVKMSGLSRRAIMDLRAERSRPHPKNQEHIAAVLREMHYL